MMILCIRIYLILALLWSNLAFVMKVDLTVATSIPEENRKRKFNDSDDEYEKVPITQEIGSDLSFLTPSWVVKVNLDLGGLKYQAFLTESLLSKTTFASIEKSKGVIAPKDPSKCRFRGTDVIENNLITLEDGTFIHANLISTDLLPQAEQMIVTQAPLNTDLKKTVADFYGMIWEKNTNVIVMLNHSNEGSKFEQYWPLNKNYVNNFGKFKVRELERREINQNIIVTSLSLTRDNDSRLIYHIWYKNWEDQKPAASIDDVLLTREVMKQCLLRSNSFGPIVTHCSAGINRSPTFVILHQALTYIEQTNELPNIKELVINMRKYRQDAVNENLYNFIFQTIIRYLNANVQ